MTAPIKRNQQIELTIEDLAFGGQGLAHIGDFVIFFQRAGIPGQKVQARIKRIRDRYAEAVIETVLDQSPLEIAPPCPYFRHCGGCRHQNLTYEHQTEYLAKQVAELYHHLGGFAGTAIAPIIPAEEIFRYRNKMEFAFSDRRWLLENDDLSRPTDFALGLRAPDNYHKALDIDDCLIAPPETAAILPLVREYARQRNLSPYNSKNHTGYLRHLMVRKGVATNQIMINIITAGDTPNLLQPLAQILRERLPHAESIVNTISYNVSGTTTGEKIHLLSGQDYITDRIGPLILKISPESFFQTNTRMAETLYDVVKKFTQPQSHQVIWDLYCGAGSIALFLAGECRQVIGLEVVRAALADARENARMNNITNAEFINFDLEKQIRTEPSVLQSLPQPETIIVDPPRGGLTPALIAVLRSIRPTRLVYVSCNPATQVRDVKALTVANEYRITTVQPVDLFPHTPHIEVVTALERT